MSSPRPSPMAQTALAQASRWHQQEAEGTGLAGLPAQEQIHMFRISACRGKGNSSAQSFMETQVRHDDCPHTLWPERHGPSESEGPQGKPEFTQRQL